MTTFEKDIFTESLIFHIPHSGTSIPFFDGFDLELIRDEINLLTDFDTDLIFNVPNTKKLVPHFSRIFCDVERLPDNEEEMFKFGRGFYYTKTDSGEDLRLDDKSIKDTVLNEYYSRHHNELNQMIEQTLNDVGFATIIDCHSFSNIPFKTDLNKNSNRPDICLGTNFSTPTWLLNKIDTFFKLCEYNVTINYPYSGTIIPKKYQNRSDVNSIMIEINRDLYMDGNGSDKTFVAKLNKQIVELFT